MSVEDNKQMVHRAFEALMAGDLSPLETLLAPDAVLHQCGFLELIPARAILRGELPGGGPLRDRQVQLQRMIGEGDIVALHWRTTGRYSDPDALNLDGRRVSYSLYPDRSTSNPRVSPTRRPTSRTASSVPPT